jgi:hypothetical protein
MTTADWIKGRRDVRQLYHWTCTEGAAGIRGDIRGDGLVRPFPDLPFRTPSTRRALGLTSQTLACDRMSRRFIVAHPERLISWEEWAAEHGAAEWADLAPGLPAHWWVADRPTRVLTKSWGKP